MAVNYDLILGGVIGGITSILDPFRLIDHGRIQMTRGKDWCRDSGRLAMRGATARRRGPEGFAEGRPGSEAARPGRLPPRRRMRASDGRACRRVRRRCRRGGSGGLRSCRGGTGKDAKRVEWKDEDRAGSHPCFFTIHRIPHPYAADSPSGQFARTVLRSRPVRRAMPETVIGSPSARAASIASRIASADRERRRPAA